MTEQARPPMTPEELKAALQGFAEEGCLDDEALGYLAADPSFAGLLYEAFLDRIEDRFDASRSFVLQAARTKGLTSCWGRWLDRVRETLTEGTVAAIRMLAPRLERIMSTELLESLPDLAGLLETVDLSGALRRTLREGVMDEWGWPAHDRANELFDEPPRQYDTDGAFPTLVLHQGNHFVAIDDTGTVWDGELPLPEGVHVQGMRLVDGELLVTYDHGSLTVGLWSDAPEETFKAEMLITWNAGAPVPGGGITEGGRVLRAGDRTFDVTRMGGSRRFFSDGQRFWLNDTFRAFQPLTGREIKGRGPRWFFEDLPEMATLNRQGCSMLPVPQTAPAGEEAAMGVRDGVFAVRALDLPEGRVAIETIDGRRWTGRIDRGTPLALLRFPGSDEVHPVTQDMDGSEVHTADGRFLLIPPWRAGAVSFNQGSAQMLPWLWWNLMRPRDPAGSRALRGIEGEALRAILAAALSENEPEPDVTSYKNLGKVTLSLSGLPRRNHDIERRMPNTAAAVREGIPQLSDAHLVAGITRIAEVAALLQKQLRGWRETFAPRPPEDRLELAPEEDIKDDDAWTLEMTCGMGSHRGGKDLGRQIQEADHFFASTHPDLGEQVLHRPVSESRIAWEHLAARCGALAFRAFATDTPQEVRDQAIRLLRLWKGTLFARAPEHLRVLGLKLPDFPVGAMTFERGQGLLAYKKTRYLLRLLSLDSAKRDFRFSGLADAPDGDFSLLPGAEILWEQRCAGSWGRPEQIEALLLLLEGHDPCPVSAEAAEALAEQTGMLGPTATLLLAGSTYRDEAGKISVPAEMRRQLRLTKAQIEVAGWELQGDLERIYADAMPPDPAWLRRPLEPDGEGLSFVDRLARAWITHRGKQSPLELDLVLALRSDFGPAPIRHDLRLRDLAELEGKAYFNRDTIWVVRPYGCFKSNISYRQGWIPSGWPTHLDMTEGQDDVPRDPYFSGWVLREYLRYFPWMYQELAVGHPLRARLIEVAERIDARLANPDLLFLAGAVDLSMEEDPERLAEAFEGLRSRFEGVPYAAPDGGLAASGLDRGDLVVTWPRDVQNSLFVSFRPARIDDMRILSDLALDLGLADPFQAPPSQCSCGLHFGDHHAVDITELRELMIWRSPGFRALLSRLVESPLPEGAYEADPRSSVPDLVAAAEEELTLSVDAAVLYLQLLTLAAPTAGRIRLWNGWSAARLGMAGVELLGRELVVAASSRELKRPWQIPGELVAPQPPALPLEACKIELYDLQPDDDEEVRSPLGPVLPLRPLHELFAEAWRRRR